MTNQSVRHVLLVLLLKLVLSGCQWGDMKEKLWFWQTPSQCSQYSAITRRIGARFKGNVSVRAGECGEGGDWQRLTAPQLNQVCQFESYTTWGEIKRSWCKITYSASMWQSDWIGQKSIRIIDLTGKAERYVFNVYILYAMQF